MIAQGALRHMLLVAVVGSLLVGEFQHPLDEIGGLGLCGRAGAGGGAAGGSIAGIGCGQAGEGKESQECEGSGSDSMALRPPGEGHTNRVF